MTTRTTSQKWISTRLEELRNDAERSSSSSSAVGDGRLVLHDIKPLFQPVWNTRTNLISIFGRARQGKSFLMNCLSGESSLFKVSNYQESCTQGIDISNKWMALSDFSSVDNPITTKTASSKPSSSSASMESNNEIHVGFVDAEGQGDKDVNYDANLICPVLLASKCVIFNWKGDLQKDHILSTLGIMTRAAKNVAVEGEGGSSSTAKKDKKSSKFGHLHVVFRDWQAIGTTSAGTHSALFNAEPSNKDTATRNQIREELKEAFESITVWLFEAPTDSVIDLRQVLTIEKTTSRFRQQIRDFRAMLSDQLAEPVYLLPSTASSSSSSALAAAPRRHPITGKVLYSMMKDIVATLNRGEVILPSSTYLTMMKEELSSLLENFNENLKNHVEDLLSDLSSLKKSYSFTVPAVPASGDSHQPQQYRYFLNEGAARKELDERIVKPLREEIARQIVDIIGIASSSSSSSSVSSASSSQYDLLYRETLSKIDKSIENASNLFSISYQSAFSQYLKNKRQIIERNIDSDIKEFLHSLNPSSSEGIKEMKTVNEVKIFLQNEVYEKNMIELNYNGYYSSSSSTAPSKGGKTSRNQKEIDEMIDDTIELLQRFYSSHYSLAVKEYEAFYNNMKEKANEIFQKTCSKMEKTIFEKLEILKSQHQKGFPKSVLLSTLDNEYSSLDKEMKAKIISLNKGKESPFVNEVSSLFYEFCAHLTEDIIAKEYEKLKESSFIAVFQHCEELLNQELGVLTNQWEKELNDYLTSLSLSEDGCNSNSTSSSSCAAGMTIFPLTHFLLTRNAVFLFFCFWILVFLYLCFLPFLVSFLL
jgi:hypothetical protein